MQRHHVRAQQANKQTIDRITELLTALTSIGAWVHGNQLHWAEGCDWPVSIVCKCTTFACNWCQSWFPAGSG